MKIKNKANGQLVLLGFDVTTLIHVSYTHLDVYKRQHIRNIEDEGINADKLRYQKELNLLMVAVGDKMTDSSRAATDLMLTAQYLSLIHI